MSVSVCRMSVCCLCIRKEFVEAYLRYIFSDSASEQYSAFSAGFLKVCGGEILSLFQPCELMAMVVGNSNYNWEVMEKVRIWVNHTVGSQMTCFVLGYNRIAASVIAPLSQTVSDGYSRLFLN